MNNIDKHAEEKEFLDSGTQEEKDAPSFLDWSNERLGEYCKKTAAYLLTKRIDGFEAVSSMAAIFILISQVEASNIGTLNMELTDVSSEIHPKPSSWKLTLEKIENSNEPV